MSRHRIDLSASFSAALLASRPAEQEIEAVQPEVAETNPPKTVVRREVYQPSDELVSGVNLAIALGRPLLLQGDPGCGKTRLAHAVAYALELPLEECYIKSTTRAQDLLYTYDTVRHLYETQLGTAGPKSSYIQYGPLGRAIVRAQYGRRSAVLIDEIDKADIDFPNDLLRELDRLEFDVAEISGLTFRVPADRPDLRPVVFVTHNEEKALPPAFLRRCIFHYVEFPKKKDEVEKILELHGIANAGLRTRAAEVLTRLRGLDLSKKPGLSELIDWVAYIDKTEGALATADAEKHLGALVKHQSDQQRVRAAVKAAKGN